MTRAAAGVRTCGEKQGEESEREKPECSRLEDTDSYHEHSRLCVAQAKGQHDECGELKHDEEAVQARSSWGSAFRSTRL